MYLYSQQWVPTTLKIRIDLDSPAPAYRQIVGAVRVLLVEGALPPGSELPSVRRLAIELGVHFNTVGEAYRQLADEGWLDLRHGRGARVIEREARAARPQALVEFRVTAAQPGCGDAVGRGSGGENRGRVARPHGGAAMIEIRWVMLVTVALTAGVMLALPHLTPRGIFFGVRTGEEFRRSEAGRSALNRYRLWVLLAAAVGVALVIAAGQSATVLIAGSVGPELICLAAFVRNYLALRPYALPPERLREADLADGAEGIPWWAMLAAPPFALPLAAMLYLREHWNQIPARYPMHFGADGRANALDGQERASGVCPALVCRRTAGVDAAAGCRRSCWGRDEARGR